MSVTRPGPARPCMKYYSPLSNSRFVVFLGGCPRVASVKVARNLSIPRFRSSTRITAGTSQFSSSPFFFFNLKTISSRAIRWNWKLNTATFNFSFVIIGGRWRLRKAPPQSSPRAQVALAPRMKCTRISVVFDQLTSSSSSLALRGLNSRNIRKGKGGKLGRRLF